MGFGDFVGVERNRDRKKLASDLVRESLLSNIRGIYTFFPIVSWELRSISVRLVRFLGVFFLSLSLLPISAALSPSSSPLLHA